MKTKWIKVEVSFPFAVRVFGPGGPETRESSINFEGAVKIDANLPAAEQAKGAAEGAARLIAEVLSDKFDAPGLVPSGDWGRT